MASQTLSQMGIDKELVIKKLKDAQRDLAEAYEEGKLSEIAGASILIAEIIHDIEQNM